MDWNFICDCIIKLCLSFVCGFILGIERKSRQQTVGMRTLILISVSSTLLALLSSYMALVNDIHQGDPSRIAAGVVSGIGFLGGGAILHQGLNIKGLTSAAIIWAAAALGLAIGSGLYIQSFAALAIIVFSLLILEKAEDHWFPAGRSKTIHLIFRDDGLNLDDIKKKIESTGIVVKDLNLSKVMSQREIILRYQVKTPREIDMIALAENLNSENKLLEFSVTD